MHVRACILQKGDTGIVRSCAFERLRGACVKYRRSKNPPYVEKRKNFSEFSFGGILKSSNLITLSKPPEGGVFDAISTDENPWPH